jgi:hypothetical protein
VLLGGSAMLKSNSGDLSDILCKWWKYRSEEQQGYFIIVHLVHYTSGPFLYLFLR